MSDGDFGGGGEVAPTNFGGGLEYGNWTPALFRPYDRSIGGIIAAVTIEEQHDDDIQITEHPVEQGAPIADHAFKRPAQVTIRAGWTVADSFDLSAETGVYGLLLSWQAALMPFDVITGKRSYSHMMMERISVTTDQHSEWALIANITCRQVIIVTTQTAKAVGAAESSNDHAEPEKTEPEKDRGEKQPTKEPQKQTYQPPFTAKPNNPPVTPPAPAAPAPPVTPAPRGRGTAPPVAPPAAPTPSPAIPPPAQEVPAQTYLPGGLF